MATYLFEALFLALTITLLSHLSRWDASATAEPGNCYNTVFTGPLYAPHPLTDMVYVSITAFWNLAMTFGAAFVGPRPGRLLLVLAAAQYPVHLYFVIAVRHANQPLLRRNGEGQEDDWDFGQTTAMLLLALAYVSVFDRTREYFSWKREEGDRRLLRSNGGANGGASESDLSLAEFGNSRSGPAAMEVLTKINVEATGTAYEAKAKMMAEESSLKDEDGGASSHEFSRDDRAAEPAALR
jgi:hypothetical protein